MIGRNDMHWITWGNKIFYVKYDFWKTKLKKLANSEIFAMSQITLEDFADSEPGAKFPVFRKTVISSLGP
jgi:hypothetical protein